MSDANESLRPEVVRAPMPSIKDEPLNPFHGVFGNRIRSLKPEFRKKVYMALFLGVCGVGSVVGIAGLAYKYGVERGAQQEQDNSKTTLDASNDSFLHATETLQTQLGISDGKVSTLLQLSTQHITGVSNTRVSDSGNTLFVHLNLADNCGQEFKIRQAEDGSVSLLPEYSIGLAHKPPIVDEASQAAFAQKVC